MTSKQNKKFDNFLLGARWVLFGAITMGLIARIINALMNT